MHYYDKKYPFLQYGYTDFDNVRWIMCSVPPEMMVDAFVKRFGCKPKTFFDCGAATGEIVYRAQSIGMDARGIDIREYPYQKECLTKLFVDGKIEIKSILACQPIKSDLAYCNGTLTYFKEIELSNVLKKFKDTKMLVAIHNTTEDVEAAAAMGYTLTTCNKPRLIKPRDWWIDTFNHNGFNTEYDTKTQCFYAITKTR